MLCYKEMHFKIFKATEQAINILITAQRECKELYLSSPDVEFKTIKLSTESKKSLDDD